MTRKFFVMVCMVVPLLAQAQAQPVASGDWTPPPLVPAAPPPTPAPEPNTPPAQPGYLPGTPGSGYTYSPYGEARNQRKAPGPEVGLMVSESLFGMLSAAGTTILPYFLLGLGGGMDQTVSGILTVALFALTPVVVAQTQTGIANGSPFYRVEAWIPLLTGLVAEGAILTTYYFANGMKFAPPSPFGSAGGVPADQSAVVWLFVGSLGLVPLLQMAAINLFKSPRAGMMPQAASRADPHSVTLGAPSVAPVISQVNGATSVGGQLQFLRGTW